MLETSEMINRLIFHEGLKLKPYYCTAGKQTIGIGRNLDDNPLTAEEKRVCGNWEKGITREMAYYLCRNDIQMCAKECRNSILFFDNLDSERQYALLDMNFQMGNRALLGFKKMLTAMGACNWDEASKQCLDSKYARDTKTRAKRIAETIRTGKFNIYF